jgi:hypothetical protein
MDVFPAENPPIGEYHHLQYYNTSDPILSTYDSFAARVEMHGLLPHPTYYHNNYAFATEACFAKWRKENVQARFATQSIKSMTVRFV